MVETPGVEGRGTTGEIVASREVSCEKGADSRGNLEGESTVSAVSCGLVEAWCSSEVSGPSERLETTVETTREQSTASVGSESAEARLAALEHLLDAITTLLDAGESGRAKMLAHAWRDGRQ
jgi:hypothetical protein